MVTEHGTFFTDDPTERRKGISFLGPLPIDEKRTLG